nr:MAG TPA: hypothetical protein [Caudoviricetes sp.]
MLVYNFWRYCFCCISRLYHIFRCDRFLKNVRNISYS